MKNDWINVNICLPTPQKLVLAIAISSDDFLNLEKPYRCIAFYVPQFTMKAYGDFADQEWCEEKHDYFLKEGWYPIHFDDYICVSVTHWQELPELPED